MKEVKGRKVKITCKKGSFTILKNIVIALLSTTRVSEQL